MLLSLALLAAQSSVQSFDVDGVRREALVFAGAGTGPHPLVLAFHGHGGGMRQASRSFRVHELWPEATVIYPQGLPTKGMTDPQGTKPGWQQKAGDEGDRDLRFVDVVLSSVKGVDRKRVFAMGHSNGGRFTYVLWVRGGRSSRLTVRRGVRRSGWSGGSSPRRYSRRRARATESCLFGDSRRRFRRWRGWMGRILLRG